MNTTAPLPKIEYPTRSINVIVPFSGGGGLDLQARSMEKVAYKYLGQAFVVQNKAGAGGVVGWNELAVSAPDGYTLGISSTDLLFHSFYGTTRFNYPTALDPLAQISAAPLVMVVNAKQPWQSVDDLLEYAKEHPQELKFGHSGIGSTPHVFGMAFSKLTGIEFGQVPFRGGSEAIAALLGNHVQMVLTNPATVKEQLRAGTLRAVAVTSEKRSVDPTLTQTPTFKELGIDLVFLQWIGIAAPKTLPREVREKLDATLEKIILDPEFKANLERMGLQVEYLNAYDAQTRWSEDRSRLKQMVVEMGIVEQVKAQQGRPGQ